MGAVEHRVPKWASGDWPHVPILFILGDMCCLAG